MAIWYLIAEAVNLWKGLTLFPTPTETLSRLVDLLGGQRLYDVTIYSHVGASLARWAAGYTLAVSFGIIMGISLRLFSLRNRQSRPFRRRSLPTFLHRTSEENRQGGLEGRTEDYLSSSRGVPRGFHPFGGRGDIDRNIRIPVR